MRHSKRCSAGCLMVGCDGLVVNMHGPSTDSSPLCTPTTDDSSSTSSSSSSSSGESLDKSGMSLMIKVEHLRPPLPLSTLSFPTLPNNAPWTESERSRRKRVRRARSGSLPSKPSPELARSVSPREALRNDKETRAYFDEPASRRERSSREQARQSSPTHRRHSRRARSASRERSGRRS